MKHIFYLLLSIVFLYACSEYQKILTKGTPEEKYTFANKLYKEGEYGDAIRLLEESYYWYRGKPQMERIQFMLAKANFLEEDYILSSEYVKHLIDNFPKSTKRREAQFILAKSYEKLSNIYKLDQENTLKAINAYQKYIYDFPEDEKTEEINNIVKKLRTKIERKAFEIAKLYYEIGYFKQAVVYADVVLEEQIGTSFKEQIYYYKLLSLIEIATNSIKEKKEKRLKESISFCDKILVEFPTSEHKEEILENKEKLKEELQIVISKV